MAHWPSGMASGMTAHKIQVARLQVMRLGQYCLVATVSVVAAKKGEKPSKAIFIDGNIGTYLPNRQPAGFKPGFRLALAILRGVTITTYQEHEAYEFVHGGEERAG